MKIIIKKIVCIVLALSMLIVGYPNFNTVQAATDNTYIYTNYWYEYNKLSEYFTQDLYNAELKMGTIANHISGQKFPLYIMKDGVTLYLNYKIFKQKNLYVYGNYAKVANNYFKCGYLIHEDLSELEPEIYYGNGYFKKPDGVECKGKAQNPSTHGSSCVTHSGNGTIRGEWKYLGYDISGNPFSNMWMINVKTETTFAERNWQPEPWGTTLKDKTGLNGISAYNQAAYSHSSNDVKAGVREWIADTVNTIGGYRGIPTNSSSYPSGYSYDEYKFMYVQSPPTLLQSGSGKMWHYRGKTLWYQTFSIPHLGAKKAYLPVDCELTAMSIIKELPTGNGVDNKPVTLEFEVKGILRDDVQEETGTASAGWTPYWQDAAARTVKYTRYDVKCWELSLSIPNLNISNATPEPTVTVHPNKEKNTAKARIKVQTTVGKLKSLPKNSQGKYIINLSAKAAPTYQDNTKNKYGTANGSFYIGQIPIPPPPDAEGKIPVVIHIPTVEIHNSIGEMAFDGVAFNDAADSTDMTPVASVELYMNGQAIEYNTFFSGQYVFPATTDKNGYFAEITCKYNLDKSKIVLEGLTPDQVATIMNDVPVQYVSVDYVYVYPTKPIAQFSITSNSWKENRILNVVNTSENGNIQLVLDRYPITEYRWSYGGDTSKLNYGTNTEMIKQLQYKAAGSYSLTLECKNTLGKWSDPYTVEYQVLEDISPNIEVNLTDSVLTRNDELSAWHYSLNSTDGDKISIAKIELWYDSDNNGTLETKKQEWNGLGTNDICEIDDFPKYTPAQLGYYKYKIYAKDEFVGVAGQDTLTQYVTATDKKSNTYEVEFWVDNYQPLSDLYMETEVNRPNVDLYIMRDKDLAQDKYTYLTDNRVTMENLLLGRNIIPSINIWDMKTYEYSTPASTSSNTGTSYPPGTVPYTSNGYSGTLSQTSVTDNGSNHDFGYTSTRSESKTVSVGGASVSGHGISDEYPPSSYSYSDSDGYSGSLSPYGYSYSSVPCGHTPNRFHTMAYFNWSRSYAGYSGSVSRTVSYWVPDVRWISDYTGYYSGNIYKYVRAPYTDPWRSSSNKYILYLGDSNITELADFNSVKSKTDAKVILAGQSTMKTQYPSYSKYIGTSGKTIQEVMNEVIEYIALDSPGIEQLYMLQNQAFMLKYGEDDLENDQIISKEFLKVHNANYFDNATGQESGTLTAYTDTSPYWTEAVPTSFANVGKYQIYRRVKDLPSGAYGSDYSYYSGASEVDIYVHRKPIALATLDWDFDSGTNTYKTTWVDQSYDLDHSVTRASTDKGITDRKIMWRKGYGEWNYTIPDNLSPGTYTLKYYAKDIENTWSDVFTINLDGSIHSNVTEVTFTLAETPPMQFEAKLRALKTVFRIPDTPVTLPAGENLELYDIWTRYPTNPVLTTAIYNSSGGQSSPTSTVNYSINTGTKSQNDIFWKNIAYNVPDILRDGNYTLKIAANAQNSKNISFPVTIKTPINLKGYINGKTSDAQVNTGEINSFIFTTSTYVTAVELKFEAATYTSSSGKIKLISNNGTTKTWQYSADIADGAFSDGKTGEAEFKAILPSGMVEYDYVNYKIVGIKASDFLITMIQDIGWRSYYFDTGSGIDDNHDGEIDRYPRRSNTNIGTLKLPVNYYSLVGYNRTYIKAGYMVKGQINIQGNPDSAGFRINYSIKGKTQTDYVNLAKSTGNTYLFQWIIPVETDNTSFVSFNLVAQKGAGIYGNEKWVDQWDDRNTDRKVLYVKGNAYEDILFVQSH